MAGPGGVPLFSIGKTIRVVHYAAQKALVGEWESLCTPQFREALSRAITDAGRLGAKSWIVDLTRDPGVPSQADLKWIETDAARLSVDQGVRAIINVHGVSALAKMGSRRWTKTASNNGMLTYDCPSLEDALEIAAKVASGEAE
jgi:hypothetical protein